MISTFLNVTAYSQYNNNIIIKNENIKPSTRLEICSNPRRRTMDSLADQVHAFWSLKPKKA
jgi:hypothetical protein